jgi:hypothetical protein
MMEVLAPSELIVHQDSKFATSENVSFDFFCKSVAKWGKVGYCGGDW